MTALAATAASGQVQPAAGGVTINFVDADLRAVVQALSPYLEKPVILGPTSSARVTLQANQPVTPSEVVGLLRTLLSSNGLELADEGGSFVVRGQAAGAGSGQRVRQVASGGGEEPQLFVIHLRHARAVDVAPTVNALYGQASALGEVGAQRATTLSDQLRAQRDAYGQPLPTAQRGAVGGGSFTGDVTIIPDQRTNSLLIRASNADYERVRAAVAQVDVRPLQVLIRVTIAEVRRNTSFSYALSAAMGEQDIPGSSNTRVGGISRGAGRDGLRTDLEITARGIGGVDLGLTLQAGVARGAVEILSQPAVFAANNERAEIVVGDQRPFVQLQVTTDGGRVDQVVQYRDVGTRLSVLPTVSDDGYVQLQVTQEVNSATDATGPGGAPVISTRSLQTALLVRDGQTAILGGLSSRLRERTSSGIPFLSDIPLIGGVFGSKRRGSDDTDLYILLTPRVVRNDAGMDETVNEVSRGAGAARGLVRKARERTQPKGAPPRQPAAPTP